MPEIIEKQSTLNWNNSLIEADQEAKEIVEVRNDVSDLDA